MVENKLIENRKAEETAENRFKIITPVLVAMEEGADVAKIVHTKKTVCEQNGISPRTLVCHPISLTNYFALMPMQLYSIRQCQYRSR